MKISRLRCSPGEGAGAYPSKQYISVRGRGEGAGPAELEQFVSVPARFAAQKERSGARADRAPDRPCAYFELLAEAARRACACDSGWATMPRNGVIPSKRPPATLSERIWTPATAVRFQVWPSLVE